LACMTRTLRLGGNPIAGPMFSEASGLRASAGRCCEPGNLKHRHRD
jgi:hypothetical protein